MFTSKTFSQILNNELVHLTATSVISDVNTGGVARSQAEAHALVVDEAYYQLIQLLNSFYFSTASGSDIDRRASDFQLQRQLSTQAQVNVTFSGSGSPSIPAGTLVAVPASGSIPQIVFITTSSGTVGSPIPAVCQISGSIGNVAASAITLIITNPNPSLITSVTNAGAATGGQDQQPDNTFVTFIQNYLQSLSKGTTNSIIAACLSIPTVSVAAVIPNSLITYSGGSPTNTNSNSDLVFNNGGSVTPTFSGQNGNIIVVIDDGTGSLPFSAVTNALQVVLGSSTNPTQYPGYVSAGISAYVTRPEITSVTVAATVILTSTANSVAVIANIQTALGNYITQLPIGAELLLSDVVNQIMNVSGVVDVDPFSAILINGSNANLSPSSPASKLIVSGGSWLTITL